jgi:hypothetical protein
MGICGMVNVFVANFPNRPQGLDPNAARFFPPSYIYLSPMDERAASAEMLEQTPCVAPDLEKRCLGNLAQTCRTVNGRKLFRTAEDCNKTSAGGNFVKMCRRSSGECCNPSRGDICQ